ARSAILYFKRNTIMSHGHDEPEPGAAAGPPGTTSDVSAPVDFTSRARCLFSIVGIGASAGGIDALKVFFSATAPDSGMAYVVIQHLSPEHPRRERARSWRSGAPLPSSPISGCLMRMGIPFLRPRRRLEQQQNLPRVPAIAVTAFARTEDRDRAMMAGFDHHLAKPLDGERLIAALSQLVQ
ncbi:MAG TPA: chemotaxis protein CheB, partial [Steroidobacteraceae bacterium]